MGKKNGYNLIFKSPRTQEGVEGFQIRNLTDRPVDVFKNGIRIETIRAGSSKFVSCPHNAAEELTAAYASSRCISSNA